MPTGTAIVYDDALAVSWAAEGFNRDLDLNQNSVVHSGTQAISTTIQSGGIVYFNYDSGSIYPNSGINTVSFWMHGGVTGGQTVKFSILPAAYDFDTYSTNIGPLTTGWQQIEIPFTQFNGLTQVTGIAWTNTSGSTLDSFYIDDIEFSNVPGNSPTATPTPSGNNTPTPTAVPSGVSIIYDDALATNWAEAGFSRTFFPSQTGTVHSGANAIETTIDSGGIVYLDYSSGSAYPNSTINAVRFWIHGGTGGDTLQFSVMPAGYDFDTHAVNITLTAGWQQVEVPFAQFGTVAQVTGIAWKNTGSSTSQTLYIDEVEFYEGIVSTPTPTNTPTPMGPTPFPTLDPGDPTSNDTYRLTFSIDRSSIPTLYYNDLTLKTYVGQATEVIVQGDGIVIPSTYSETTGYVQYSTEASSVVIDIVGGVDVPWLGTTQKMVMKEGKSWAWSHGFDDNVELFPAIDLFEAKGWQGSIYLIGDTIDDTRDENWIVDAPAAQRLLADGWSLGSHGWNNSCTDYNQPQMEQGIDRIEEVVSTSLVPDYKVIAYAAPCLISNYHPIVLNMRDTQVNDMLFNESGNNYLQVIDPDGAGFTVGDNTAVAFNIDEPIGRDISIETESLATMEAIVDWVSTNSNSSQHVWYNTLSHGDQEGKLSPFINYVYNNYGPAGTDEVWVAPADEIYSYILVRDEAVVTLDQVTLVQGPTATPTTAPTQTPTATPTIAPTQTPTATPILPPTATPTPGPAAAWTQVATTTQPDVIAGYAMTFDTARNVTVLYGGGRTWPYSNETWEFNGTSWSKVTTTAEPNARYGMTLVYDSVRNKTFLFGGSDEQDNELNETWELVGGTWLQLSPTNGSPPERTGHAATWNGSNNQMVIHGGNKSDTTLDDLWAFDGSTWTEVATTNTPPSRTEHSLAFSSGELLLYGGRSSEGTLLSETAILNLATSAWTVSSGSDPGARQKHALVYWPDRGIFVLAGGTASASQSYGRLAWEHAAAGTWNSLADGPIVMSDYPAVGVYDASDQSIVVFVGTETWVLK